MRKTTWVSMKLVSLERGWRYGADNYMRILKGEDEAALAVAVFSSHMRIAGAAVERIDEEDDLGEHEVS